MSDLSDLLVGPGGEVDLGTPLPASDKPDKPITFTNAAQYSLLKLE